MLTRLAELRMEIAMVLEGKCDFVKYLCDKEFILRLTYLADIFSRLNELNFTYKNYKVSVYLKFMTKLDVLWKIFVLWKNCIYN